MDKFVARLNIEHFRKQVAEESDDAKRNVLLELLAKEEKVLANLLAKSSRQANKG